MGAIALLRREPAATALAQAWVAGADGDAFLLSRPSGEPVRARRAAGCLLQPEAGDMVLACLQPGGTSYVVCVLEKAGEVATLALGPEVTLTARSGQLELQGAEVAVRARTAMRLEAPAIHFLGRTLDLVFDRLVQRARNSFRWIQELDQVHARRSHTAVSERYTLRSGSASIVAEDEVKVDGKRINLG